uniref:cGMP-dependent protein kinase n=1 Tax=Mantoniella antarctica TaxID=81844 RepID=A0A7S0STZ7_9CHLO
MDIVAQAEAREEQARSCFASHDLDGSGNIDARELLYALMDLGLKHADEDVASFKTLVERCMKEHDANADGVLSWTEFQQMYNAVSGVRSEARREAASNWSLDARLPKETFTSGPALRDDATGGIQTDIRKDFRLSKTLGTGGFAVVKSAVHLRSKKVYAVKIINIALTADDDEDGMTLEEIATEIRLTMSLSHTKHVVKVFDYYITASHVYVVMEDLKGGELLEALMDEGEYGESDTATLLYELFTGLESIHARSITHRDLKLENLIFAERNNLSSLRIIDFGLAKKMKTARGKLVLQCGTAAYVAPEVISGRQYTPAVDMWAAGVIMYAMLCGGLPFDHRDQQKSFRLIAKGQYHALPAGISAEARDLLDQLLCVDTVKRLTANEALAHRWIRKHNANLNGGLSERSLKAKSRMHRAAESRLGGDLEMRTLKAGELLIKRGARANEVFLIKEGQCVVVVEVDGKEVLVAERGEGEFVGEMGVSTSKAGDVEAADGASVTPERSSGDETEASSSPSMGSFLTLMRVKKSWVGGRRGADVRATTDMKVMVMSSSQMHWILEHDYGADGEMAHEVHQRRLQMDKSLRIREDGLASEP